MSTLIPPLRRTDDVRGEEADEAEDRNAAVDVDGGSDVIVRCTRNKKRRRRSAGIMLMLCTKTALH
jgi:hypothetical protein